jgi:hypothetical protein
VSTHWLRKALLRHAVGAIAVASFIPAAAQESVWNHPWTCAQFLSAYDESRPASTAEAMLGKLYPFSAYIFIIWANANEEEARRRLPIIQPVHGEGLQYISRAAVLCRNDTTKRLKAVAFTIYQEGRSLNGVPILRSCTLNQPGISCAMGQ